MKATAYESNGSESTPDHLRRAAEKAFSRQTKDPESGALRLTDVELASGSNAVSHGLGRIPVDYAIGKQNAAADIYWEAWDRDTITLNASTPVTINLKVF